MSEQLTRAQERKLLEVQARLARLKIQAAQMKKQQQRRQETQSVRYMLHFANSASSFVGNNHLLKLAMLPASWKHRVLLGGALLAWECYRNYQNHAQAAHNQRRIVDITPPKLYLDNKE